MQNGHEVKCLKNCTNNRDNLCIKEWKDCPARITDSWYSCRNRLSKWDREVSLAIACLLLLVVLIVGGLNSIEHTKQLEGQISQMRQEITALKSGYVKVDEPTTMLHIYDTDFLYLKGYEIKDGRAYLKMLDGQVLNYPENICKFEPGHLSMEELKERGCIYIEEEGY